MSITARGAIAELGHLIRITVGRPTRLDRRCNGDHRVLSRVRVGDVLLGIPARWPSNEPYRTRTAVIVCLCSLAITSATDDGAERMYARHLADPGWPENDPRRRQLR